MSPVVVLGVAEVSLDSLNSSVVKIVPKEQVDFKTHIYLHKDLA